MGIKEVLGFSVAAWVGLQGYATYAEVGLPMGDPPKYTMTPPYLGKLIILLALLVGVLYSLHILVQDYQALTAASKFLRFLFKRDLSTHSYTKPAVRWKRILLCDPIQCARYFYCELGAQPGHNEVLRGFVYMLTLDPTEQDTAAHAVFKEAYEHGLMHPDKCREKYALCPFNSSLLFDLIRYLLRHQ